MIPAANGPGAARLPQAGGAVALWLERRSAARRRTAMLLPALAHVLVALLHLRETLLERRAHGRLLLVVQAVVESEPRVRALFAQLRILLLDLLMRSVQCVQIEDRLLLHGLELLLHLFMVGALGLTGLLHRVECGLPLLFLIRVQVELAVQLAQLLHEMTVPAAGTAGTTHRRIGLSGMGDAEAQRKRSSGYGEKT